jgi:hypothetical protein
MAQLEANRSRMSEANQAMILIAILSVLESNSVYDENLPLSRPILFPVDVRDFLFLLPIA